MSLFSFLPTLSLGGLCTRRLSDVQMFSFNSEILQFTVNDHVYALDTIAMEWRRVQPGGPVQPLSRDMYVLGLPSRFGSEPKREDLLAHRRLSSPGPRRLLWAIGCTSWAVTARDSSWTTTSARSPSLPFSSSEPTHTW
jgi:hypothetical protein